MQKTMPYRTLHQWPTCVHQNNVKTRGGSKSESMQVINGDLERMVKENAVIVFAKSGCCLGHVVKRLLQVVGANPAVYEVEENDVANVACQLADAAGGLLQFPAVFIGGRWFGGLERIIATHITEELTPLLKQAGALWL